MSSCIFFLFVFFSEEKDYPRGTSNAMMKLVYRCFIRGDKPFAIEVFLIFDWVLRARRWRKTEGNNVTGSTLYFSLN